MIDRMTETYNTLSILDRENNEVMEVYTYNFSSELMGRESIVIELSLPIQYEDVVEKPYPFSTSWHINYNNDIYFLNSENPTGVKDNQSRYIKYTLVFESLRNSLNDTFIKPYGRVYRDENNDGYADPEEVISDILLGKDIGFYGNIYDFVLWLRKSFENSYGYIQDQDGNDIEINGHYALKYTVILNKVEYNTDDYSDQDVLYQQEYADMLSNSPHYNVSDVENIDATNTTFFTVLQKMNEVFTYNETINGKEKKIGYTFSFRQKSINGYSYYVIIIDPDSDVVKNAADEDVVFEYGGLKKGGGLQSITRTTQDNRLPTRIYGNGSGENLPVNYFYIKEDRSNEIWNIDERKIQSINDLSTYFTNHPDEIDYTKQYLVPDEDYPFVYDKYIYAGGRIPLATSNFTYSTTFNVVSTTVIKTDGIDVANNQYFVNGVAFPMKFGYIYLVENNNIWNAFYFNASGNNDIPAETVIDLGVWSDNDLGEGFDNNTGLPIITNTFLTNGTKQNLENSKILVLVNKSNNLEILEENKIYYVIMPNADNTGSYLGTFFVKSSGMWYNTELQTYERVNPYTKYISNLQVLFPDFLRSYIAGWRYGYMYVKANATENNGVIMCLRNISTDYQINKDYDSLDNITINLITLYIIKDIYPMAYMRYKDSWEFVGILETDTDNEYYNKDIFDKGLQDFCKGIRQVQQPFYDYTVYDYTECGKVYRPITYYEDKELKEKYGIIEVRKDFDIKPSIVKLYLKGQGRLDELVDVYIPCLDDESAEEDRNNPEKWGKYWEDTAFIVTDDNGNKYNRKVPDLIFPQKSEEYIIIKTKNITSSPYLALADDSVTEVNIHNYNAEAVFNNPSIRNSLYIKEDSREFASSMQWTWNNNTQEDATPCVPFEYDVYYPIYWKMINSVDNTEIQSQTRIAIKKFKVRNIVALYGGNLGRVDIPDTYFNQNFGAYITDMAFGNVSGNNIITRIEFFAQSASLKNQYDIPKNENINNYIRTTFNTYNRSGWKLYSYTRKIDGGKSLKEVDSGYTTLYHCEVKDLETTNIIDMEYMFNTYIEDVKVQIIPNFTQYGVFQYNIKYNSSLPATFSTHKKAWAIAKNKHITIRPPKILAFNIRCSLNVIFDETREFFIYTKDIRFNPALPAFQGEQVPDVVFSSGDLQGIDNKFAFSQIPSHKTEYFTRLQTGKNIPLSAEDGNLIEEIPVITTQESENDTTTIEVPATYRATLGFILPDTADNQSVFRYLPQRNIKPKAKDLFILENVLYPHNPYVYEAERKLSKSLREELDLDARYTYTIIFDDIRREVLGIDWHQLRVGNKIYIKNNSLITTNNEDYAIFIIEKVSIEKREDSLYDRYTLVLKNYTKQGHTNVINPLDNGGGYRRFSDTVITTDTFNDTVVDLRNNFSGLIKPLKKLAQKNETNNTDNTLKINGLEHKTNIIQKDKLSYKETDVLPKEMEEDTLYFIPNGKGGLDAYLYSEGEAKKIN